MRRRLAPAAFARVCDQFLSSTSEVLVQLGAAAREGDLNTVGQLAHRLRGSMATLGAVRLSTLAHRVEEGGFEDEEGLDAVLREMDEEYRRVQATVVSLKPSDVQDE
jgi:HPt (histidine-containing phosphotransfer) domain-containing protein